MTERLSTSTVFNCQVEESEITKTQKGTVIDLGEWLKGGSGQLCDPATVLVR